MLRYSSVMLKPRCLYRKSLTVANMSQFIQCTEVRLASFLSCEFTTMAVINSPERKVAKCTSVCSKGKFFNFAKVCYCWRVFFHGQKFIICFLHFRVCTKKCFFFSLKYSFFGPNRLTLELMMMRFYKVARYVQLVKVYSG